ncbi:hypothetical protein CbuD7D7780_00850 [Coxiella burnetii]|uniref:Hypothetical membrane spanning protein n=1 Tax=Coxiella burnetii (strain Dugway 5J108-111) TaxID=434922 RepID=A9KBE9_COXBN|nr:hypothetical protein [Coxiella burnetii]ABS77002.1 hypothetical membrane spanning protein [Coxiella burnetii Dugway 5J108-111]OYK81024.1 hypothetical protein CbuD7E6568_00850 [Coxiella burnetii]OYK83113.1 hypothetical protein CbuD7D7780_00850 [Coxiella burnetii]
MFSYLSTCRAFPDLKKIINSRSTDAFLRGLARAMSSKMFIELMGKLAGYEETMAGNICSIPVFAITAYTSYVGTQWWSNDPRELRSYVANRSSLCQTFLRILDALFRGIARGDTMSTVILLIGTLNNSNLLPLAGVLAVVTAGGGAFTSYNRTFSRTEYVRLMPRESDSDSEDVFSPYSPLSPFEQSTLP